MKKAIINTASVFCFLLAALTSNAQQGKAPATPAAQIAAENGQQTATPSNAKDAELPLQPGAKTVQQSAEKAVPVVVSKPYKTEEPKPVALKNAPAENSNSMQNIDRPKTSTIQPDKKEKPLANEGPKTPEKQL
jgi:hypothetical protein